MTPNEDSFSVRFWGVRGGIPTTGKNTRRFGGNTPCVEVRCGAHVLIFDAGTGIRALGHALNTNAPVEADIFFSETRFDHACGLPFFTSGYHSMNTFRAWAGHLGPNGSLEQSLNALFTSPHFPISLSYFAGFKEWRDFTAGDTLPLEPDITLRTAKLNHPNGATGYRVEFRGRALCYVNNTCHVPGKADQAVLDLIQGADLVIYDSYYDDADYPSNRAIGHSTWQEGLRLCHAAEAHALCAFQHNPDSGDKTLARIQRQIKKQMPGSFVASEGKMIEL